MINRKNAAQLTKRHVQNMIDVSSRKYRSSLVFIRFAIADVLKWEHEIKMGKKQ